MKRSLFLGFVLVSIIPVLASAASVQYNTTYGGVLCVVGQDPGHTGCAAADIYYPNMNVAENVQVVNAQTGAPIPSGSSVPQGTQIEFEFVPHQSQDINWFGTGGSIDSPYGQWVNGAGSGSSCVDSNEIGNNNFTDLEGLFPDGAPSNAGAGIGLYGNLAVNPPSESMSALDGLGCTTTSSGAVCNTPTPGTYSPTFNWGSTYGHMYIYYSEDANSNGACAEHTVSTPGIFGSSGTTRTFYGGTYSTLTGWQGTYSTPQQCINAFDSTASAFPNTSVSNGLTCTGGTALAGGGWYGSHPSSTYTLNVPQQSLPYTITITPTGPTGPNPPTVSDDLSSCTTDGIPSYTNQASDSDASAQLRYGISWDNSGTIEEWVPATGYVPQGTAETVEQAGQGGTFEVIAEDQQGNSSSWTIHAPASCPAGNTPNPGGSNTQCPQGELSENGECVTSCDVGYTEEGDTCSFSGCPANYAQQGNDCVLASCPAGQILENGSCVTAGLGGSGEGGNGNPAGDIATWKVSPLLVQSGQTATITWSAANVIPSSCTVHGTDGESWTGAEGTETSKGITAQTIFTFTCTGLDNVTVSTSSIVSIVPVFIEH